MKKILLLLILFIYSISIVNATSDDIVYEWGNYIHSENTYTYSYILDVEENETGTFVIGEKYLRSQGKIQTISIYDNTGKLIKENELEEYCDYGAHLVGEMIFCQQYNVSNKIVHTAIYDSDFKLIKEIENEFINFNDYKNETEEYYIIGNNVVDKKNYNVLNIYDLIEEHKDFEEYENASTLEEANKVLKSIIDELFPDINYSTKILMDLNLPPLNNENITHVYPTYGTKKAAISYYNSTTKECNVEIYNDEYEVELNKKIDCDVDIPKVLLYDNSFVIIKEMINSFTAETEKGYREAHMKLSYTEYDYKGNIIYNTDLKEIYSEFKDKISDSYIFGLNIVKISKLKNSFTIFIEYGPYPEGNINETETIEGRTALILKYSYRYDINIKTDGNGTITANKVTASSGEEIEYTITPKEGYVLGVVTVTDSNGNKVTFTSNKFTMPSSDVTIDVTFVLEAEENPDTSSMSIFILASFLIILSSIYLMIKQIKEFKWIKN